MEGSSHVLVRKHTAHATIYHNKQYAIYSKRKNLTDLYRTTCKYIMFLWKYEEKQFFCGHTTLIEGVFLTQLSSNAGISV